MTQGVTIGQAAAFAGVTVKTVRHYHRIGLVDEPPRDTSGYRRYGSADLLRLVQVRTLSAAGVPLAEVSTLLASEPEAFATALADVDQRLTAQIHELKARQTSLRRLAAGDHALLPDRAHAIVERLVELGFDDDYVRVQQDALVLMRALVPDGFEDFLELTEQRLADPVHVELQHRSWQAATWPPDDPRLEKLAADLAASFLRGGLPTELPDSYRSPPDAAARLALVSRHGADDLPTLDRLNRLVEAHLRAAGVAVPYS